MAIGRNDTFDVSKITEGSSDVKHSGVSRSGKGWQLAFMPSVKTWYLIG
jgi:hypothetical protein